MVEPLSSERYLTDVDVNTLVVFTRSVLKLALSFIAQESFFRGYLSMIF